MGDINSARKKTRHYVPLKWFKTDEGPAESRKGCRSIGDSLKCEIKIGYKLFSKCRVKKYGFRIVTYCFEVLPMEQVNARIDEVIC